MNREELKRFFEASISDWSLAKENSIALKTVLKKKFKVDDLEGIIQYNPKRAVSTLAKVDKNDLKKRACFLCEKNRPAEQKYIEILPGWQLLVNPFPILQYHFTIVNIQHVPQKLEPSIGIDLACKLPEMVIFYNSEGAGASAPDHCHFQAVPKDYLPLIKLVEKNTKAKLPFKFNYFSDHNFESLKEKLIEIVNLDKQNVFFWRDESSQKINVLSIPRKIHRPSHYFKPLPERRAISPGALDMAGIIVTPFQEDFEKVNDKEIKEIYKEVAFTS